MTIISEIAPISISMDNTASSGIKINRIMQESVHTNLGLSVTVITGSDRNYTTSIVWTILRAVALRFFFFCEISGSNKQFFLPLMETNMLASKLELFFCFISSATDFPKISLILL